MAQNALRLPIFRPEGYRIHRGAYRFYRDTFMYAEESFEVFKNRKDHSLHFKGELISRVSTGELLTVSLDYFIGRDSVPKKVLVNRKLGSDHVAEFYEYDQKRSILQYQFIESFGLTTRELKTPAKFHVAVPNACCSTLCLRQESQGHEVGTSYLWKSFNKWGFQQAPTLSKINTQRASHSYEEITIGSSRRAQATVHRITHYGKDKAATIYLSKFEGIPYIIKTDQDNVKIEALYLQNLEV